MAVVRVHRTWSEEAEMVEAVGVCLFIAGQVMLKRADGVLQWIAVAVAST